MPAPVNYTTQVPATRTVAEMQKMLAEYGATRIGVDYENQSPSSLTFVLEVRGEMRAFTLPVNIDAMQRMMTKKSVNRELKSLSREKARSREQAERVAWRVLKDWLAAQLALIESSMAELDQVMLPYMRVSLDGTSLYELIRDQGLPALESGR